MKLECIKRIPAGEPLISASALKDDSAVFLNTDKDGYYQLLLFEKGELNSIRPAYDNKGYQMEHRPALFSTGTFFGLISSREELVVYNSHSLSCQTIRIGNTEMLPQGFRVCYPRPVSDRDTLPVCFEGDGMIGIPRYIAFLKLNTFSMEAVWMGWLSLDPLSFPHHKAEHPPKVDSAMISSNELFVFTSGGKAASVSKWGMDYYALAHVERNGRVKQLLIDSGGLEAMDQKKRGVNGVFSSSHNNLFLTPVFSGDEWQGKQRVFSLNRRALEEIQFPRGFGKYAQAIEEKDGYWWVNLRDTREVALCRAV